MHNPHLLCVLGPYPGVAIYVRIAQNTAQQVKAYVAPVWVWNHYISLAGCGHDLMLGAREWAIVAQILQLTDELCSRARGEARHEVSLAVTPPWRTRYGEAVKLG